MNTFDERYPDALEDLHSRLASWHTKGWTELKALYSTYADILDTYPNGSVGDPTLLNFGLTLTENKIPLFFDELEQEPVYGDAKEFKFFTPPVYTSFANTANSRRAKHKHWRSSVQVVNSSYIREQVASLAAMNPVNRVEHYLKEVDSVGLEFDDALRQLRLVLATDDPNDYLRPFMAGMVRRALKPGSPLPFMLLILGKQGGGKSTFVESLVPTPFRPKGYVAAELAMGRFTDSATKKMVEQTKGRLVVEFTELSGFRRADLDALKRYIPLTHDYARLAYRRDLEDYPRTWAIVGTANPTIGGILPADDTGYRRFAIVHSNLIKGAHPNATELGYPEDTPGHEVVRGWMKVNVDRIWAATYQHLQGLSQDAHEMVATLSQEQIEAADGEGEQIAHVNEELPDLIRALPATDRQGISPASLLSELETMARDFNLRSDIINNQRARGAELRRAGWNDKVFNIDGKSHRRWISPPGWAATPLRPAAHEEHDYK